MRQFLEVGVEYWTKEGKPFRVDELHAVSKDVDGRGEVRYCTDGWNRFSSGENAGKWVGRERDPDWKHHVAFWPFVEQICEQLELFE